MPISVQHVFGLGEDSGVPGGNPEAQGKHANSKHAVRRRDSNPRPIEPANPYTLEIQILKTHTMILAFLL